jgi:hypothetical protein
MSEQELRSATKLYEKLRRRLGLGRRFQDPRGVEERTRN